MRFMILPYQQHSEGAAAVAEALDGLRIRLRDSEYTYREGDCVINWGNGDSQSLMQLPEGAMLNPNVNICINKKKFFERMQGHNIVPPFAFSKEEAMRHLAYPILCRTRTEGADGDGCVVADESDQMASAALYTQLLEKTAEYRVHMGRNFAGDIVLIAAQKKRVISDHAVDPRIWTGDSVVLDYLEPHELPRHVFDVTKRSMELMPELHFAGFDTIDTTIHGARVVEANSAPMMTPTVTRKYAEFFKQYVADRDFVPEPEVVEHNILLSNNVPMPFPEEDPSEMPDYQAGYADGRRETLNELLGMVQALHEPRI